MYAAYLERQAPVNLGAVIHKRRLYSFPENARRKLSPVRPMETNMSASFLRVMLIASAVCGTVIASPVNAQAPVATGQLTCGVKGGVSFIIGSTRELRCVFRVNPNDEGERYVGQIEKYGLDIGTTDNAILT